MAPKLYLVAASPGVRSVRATAKVLGIQLEEIEFDFLEFKHMSPEYLKLNPLHTVPTLDDNGNVICDSHAITTYLVGKYGKDDSLYPKDLYKRALVDQKLAFDLGTLFPILRTVDVQYIKKEITSVPPKTVEAIKEACEFLEKFQDGKKWIAGDCFTLGDIHCVTTLTCLEYHLKVDSNLYPNTAAWKKRTLELPCFASDNVGRDAFTNLLDRIRAMS